VLINKDKNMKKYKILLLLILLLPLFVFAQDVQSGDDIIRIIMNITTWLWRLFMIVTVLVFMYIGFVYLTAAGNPDKITTAHNMIKYGIIGIVVALLSGGMVQLIQSFLGA
jgi:fumarate reductase subunit D